jgi:hypothetical protein
MKRIVNNQSRSTPTAMDTRNLDSLFTGIAFANAKTLTPGYHRGCWHTGNNAGHHNRIHRYAQRELCRNDDLTTEQKIAQAVLYCQENDDIAGFTYTENVSCKSLFHGDGVLVPCEIFYHTKLEATLVDSVTSLPYEIMLYIH